MNAVSLEIATTGPVLMGDELYEIALVPLTPAFTIKQGMMPLDMILKVKNPDKAVFKHMPSEAAQVYRSEQFAIDRFEAIDNLIRWKESFAGSKKLSIISNNYHRSYPFIFDWLAEEYNDLFEIQVRDVATICRIMYDRNGSLCRFNTAGTTAKFLNVHKVDKSVLGRAYLYANLWEKFRWAVKI